MSKNEIPYKIYLSESELPKSWYNLRADMKNNDWIGRPSHQHGFMFPSWTLHA